MYYSREVFLILLAMVLTGALRSVAVKMFYQMGFEKPFFITILFHIAGLPAFGLYCIQKYLERRRERNQHSSDIVTPTHYPVSEEVNSCSTNEAEVEFGSPKSCTTSHSIASSSSSERKAVAYLRSISSPIRGRHHRKKVLVEEQVQGRSLASSQKLKLADKEEKLDTATKAMHSSLSSIHNSIREISHHFNSSLFEHEEKTGNEMSITHSTTTFTVQRMGSRTGLTQESHVRAESLLNYIPYWLQLTGPGILDFFTYLARWGAFIYTKASVAEMLLNGTELVMSAVAARVIRRRSIHWRWVGVWVVTLGLIVIGAADVLSVQNESNTGNNDNDVTNSSANDVATTNSVNSNNTVGRNFIGISLILVASLLGTVLTMAEEILTQEGDWSVLVVMGNEGLWGLTIGLVLYVPLAEPLFNEGEPWETWNELVNSTWNVIIAIGLVVLFAATGAINIFSIALTSSMTRNIWQHLKAIPVWAIGLAIYYSTITFGTNNGNEIHGDQQLGEPWMLPYSIFVFLGFVIIVFGVYIYYRKPATALSSGRRSIAINEETDQARRSTPMDRRS